MTEHKKTKRVEIVLRGAMEPIWCQRTVFVEMPVDMDPTSLSLDLLEEAGESTWEDGDGRDVPAGLIDEWTVAIDQCFESDGEEADVIVDAERRVLPSSARKLGEDGKAV